MQYAVVEGVHVAVSPANGLVCVWLDAAPVLVQVCENVEVAHTWLVDNGYQPIAGQLPTERGLYEHYVRVIPVVLL